MSESQSTQCEQCQQRYTLFKRRKQCNLCGQEFCSKCAPRSTGFSRVCHICLLISNDKTSREQLASIRIRHLRAYLIHSKATTHHRLEHCVEKQDLINLIQARKRNVNEETYVFVERPETNNIPTTSANSSTAIQQEIVEEMPTNRSDQVPPVSTSSAPVVPPSPGVPVIPRATLSDVPSVESIPNLTIRQLKEILIQNFISIKGCVEKNELIHKVEQLYRDQQTDGEQTDENSCKVCMDAKVDCVFLDCGHLCTCVRCGKQLTECPMCRAYIVRVVRVFKS